MFSYVQTAKHLFVGEEQYPTNNVIPRNGKTYIQESFLMADGRQRVKLPADGRMRVRESRGL